MAAEKPLSGYALGYTDAEHARLIYQASRLAPLTERVFREAGIASGQRVHGELLNWATNHAFFSFDTTPGCVISSSFSSV